MSGMTQKLGDTLTSWQKNSEGIPPSEQMKLSDLFRMAHFPKHHTSVKGRKGAKEWFERRGRLWSSLFPDSSNLAPRGVAVALIGDRGTGKTQMSVDIGVKFIKKTMLKTRYTKIMDIFFEIKETYDNPDRSERDVLRSYNKNNLLIIDEIHEKLDSDWSRSLFTYMMDCRYDQMKSTILIGNVSNDEFADIVGTSAYDRLRETGGVINCNWESFR